MEEKQPKNQKETNNEETPRENIEEADDKDLDQARGGVVKDQTLYRYK